jgi:hypothetical protein
VLGSYETEVQEMLRWQRARYDWMDGVITGRLGQSFTPMNKRCQITGPADWTVPFSN